MSSPHMTRICAVEDIRHDYRRPKGPRNADSGVQQWKPVSICVDDHMVLLVLKLLLKREREADHSRSANHDMACNPLLQLWGPIAVRNDLHERCTFDTPKGPRAYEMAQADLWCNWKRQPSCTAMGSVTKVMAGGC